MQYGVIDETLVSVFLVFYEHLACALTFVRRGLELCVVHVLVMSLGAKVWPPEAQAGGSVVLV